MLRRLRLLLLSAAFVLEACVPGVTEADIERSINEELSSVSGDWTGIATGVSLAFTLTESTSGALVGTGTWQSASGATSQVPITLSGTYQRPVLTLAIEGIVHEGRSVRGAFRGSYSTIGGVSDTLVLTGAGYERRLSVLLQER